MRRKRPVQMPLLQPDLTIYDFIPPQFRNAVYEWAVECIDVALSKRQIEATPADRACVPRPERVR